MLILGDGNVTEGLPDSPLWVAIVKILFIVRVVTRPLAPPAETPSLTLCLSSAGFMLAFR